MSRRCLLGVSLESGGGKIVNKMVYSIGRLDKITFTFEYPVESDVYVYFVCHMSGTETSNPVLIPKGNNTISIITDAYINNDTITITRIVPNEDNVYIYTW